MPTGLLTYLQETSLAIWVSQSPSLFGYPTILTLHTVGLALLVGGSVAIDLQLLGVARGASLSASARLFNLMWAGLAINGLSGGLLFMADAVNKAQQPVFWIKLACIAGAVTVLIQIRAIVAATQPDVPTPLTARGRTLAVVSLVFWVGAIVAGRLMAYLK